MTAQPSTTGSFDESHGAPPRSGTGRLYRSRTNRVFAGVCGGIAERYGSDPSALRLAALLLGLFTGVIPMVVVYIVAAVVIPEQDGPPGVVAHDSNVLGDGSLALGVLLIVVGLAWFANTWLRIDWQQVWPVALIGLGGLMIVATFRPRP